MKSSTAQSIDLLEFLSENHPDLSEYLFFKTTSLGGDGGKGLNTYTEYVKGFICQNFSKQNAIYDASSTLYDSANELALDLMKKAFMDIIGHFVFDKENATEDIINNIWDYDTKVTIGDFILWNKIESIEDGDEIKVLLPFRCEYIKREGE